MRLDKYLSEALQITRANSTNLLKNKQITVNGEILTKGDIKISDSDEVLYKGLKVQLIGDEFYMLNKPFGFVTSTDEREGKSVYSLINSKRANAIGRLDKDTTGLLLFTSRGDVIHYITSPKLEIEKEYIVTTEEDVKNIESLLLEKYYSNGKRGAYIGKAKSVCKLSDKSFSIVITEGKFHEIKEMVKGINLTLVSLKRVRVGNIVLDDTLEEGKYRKLNEKEINSLLKHVPVK